MKTIILFPLMLIVLWLTATLSIAQVKVPDQNNSGKPATEQTKKKSFFRQLGEAAWGDLKDNMTVNGRPVGTGSDRSNQSSGASVGQLRGITVQGEWKEYGAGGGGGNCISPRNHFITFDMPQDNSQIRITYESTLSSNATVYSSTGQQIGNLYYGNPDQVFNFPRAGTYQIVVCINDRYATGSYVTTLGEGAQNVQKKDPAYWHQEGVSFGDEGGGGSRDNYFSPRNHCFFFEPEQGTVYDVSVESNGVPVQVAVIDPNGTVNAGSNGGGPGVHYVIDKAQRRGIYRIFVATNELNEQGQYKIEVIGKLKTNPTRVSANQQTVKTRFANNAKRHEYTISITKPGIVELLYRSTNTEADFILYDEYGQQLNPHFDNSPTPRLIDRSFEVKKTGTLKLILETQQPTVGDYELLAWGDFDSLRSQQIKAPETPPQQGKIPNYKPGTSKTSTSNGSAIRLVSDETVEYLGQIKGLPAGTDYATLKVQYADLNTREVLGTVAPGTDGDYRLALSRGRKYDITALSENGNVISSSRNVDLTGKTTGGTWEPLPELNYMAPIEFITATDVGKVIALNNIFFDTGQSTLRPESFAELNRLQKFLTANPSVRVEISGHTDNQGSATINEKLSADRARAVSYYFQGNGVMAGRIPSAGYGPKKPKASNASIEGRQLNRRVEFKIINQ